MTLHRIIRAECETCRKTVLMNTNCTIRTHELLERRGWTVHKLDSYGNYSEFCSEKCRDDALKLCGEYIE